MFLGNGYSNAEYADPKISTEAWYDVRAKFTRYWNSIKSKLSEIKALGPTIADNIRRYNTSCTLLYIIT